MNYYLIVIFTLIILSILLSILLFNKNRTLLQQNSKLKEFANWQSLALTDDLTGVENRTAYHKKINQIEKNTAKSSAAILLFDIDDFKQINDTFGHLAGDKILQLAASALSELCSEFGFSPYRIGGDEFAVLVENTTETNVINFLLKLRDYENTSNEFRFSKGYSMINKNESNSLSKAFARADEMLYADKASKK